MKVVTRNEEVFQCGSRLLQPCLPFHRSAEMSCCTRFSCCNSLLLFLTSAQVKNRSPILYCFKTTYKNLINCMCLCVCACAADRPLFPFRVIILLKQFISSICPLLDSAEHDDVMFAGNFLVYSDPAAGPATSTATPKDQTGSQVAGRRSTSAASVPKSTTGSPT